MKTALKYIYHLVLALGTTWVAGVGLFILLLNFQTTQRFFWNYIENALLESDVKVDVQGFEGTLPFRFTAKKIVVKQNETPIFQAEDLAFKWGWWALFKGILDIEYVKVGDTTIYLPTDERPNEGRADQPLLNPWPSYFLPFSATLESLEIAKLQVREGAKVSYAAQDIKARGHINTFSKISLGLTADLQEPAPVTVSLKARGSLEKEMLRGVLSLDSKSYAKGQIFWKFRRDKTDKNKLVALGDIKFTEIYGDCPTKIKQVLKAGDFHYFVVFSPEKSIRWRFIGSSDLYLKLTAIGSYNIATPFVKSVVNFEGRKLEEFNKGIPNHLLVTANIDGPIDKLVGGAEVTVPIYTYPGIARVSDLTLRAKTRLNQDNSAVDIVTHLDIAKISSDYLKRPIALEAGATLNFIDNFTNVSFKNFKLVVVDKKGQRVLTHKATGKVNLLRQEAGVSHDLKFHDPAILSDAIPQESSLDITGGTQGTPQHHEMKLKSQGNFGKTNLEGELDMLYDPQGIDVRDATLQTEAFSASLQGKWHRRTNSLTGGLKGNILNLGALDLPNPIQGQGHFSITEKQNRFNADFSMEKVVYEGYSVDKIDFQMGLPAVMDLPQLLTKGVVDVKASGVNLQGRHHFQAVKLSAQGGDEGASILIKASGIDDLLDFITLKLLVDKESNSKSGALRIETFKGAHNQLYWDLKNSPTFSWATHTKRVYALSNTVIESLDGIIAMSGQLEDQNIKGHVKLDRFQLANLVRIYPEFPLLGSITGAIDVDGNTAVPNVSADLSVRNLKNTLMPNKFLVPYDLRFTGKMASGKAQLDLALTAPNKETFKAHVQAKGINFGAQGEPLRKAAWTATLKGPLDLFYWTSLFYVTDATILEGTLESDLALKLHNAQLTGQGHLLLRGLEAQYLTTGSYLKGGQVTAVFKGDKIRLSGKLMDYASGAADLSGYIQVGQDFQFNPFVTLQLNKMSVIQLPLYKAIVSGDIRATKKNRVIWVDGVLTADESYVVIPKSSPASFGNVVVRREGDKQVERNADKSLEAEKNKAASPVYFYINLNIPGDLMVQGFGLDSQWQGRLSAKGPMNNVVFGGDVQVKQGTLNLFGKAFKVTRGQVMLVDNPGGLTAFIDLQSQAMIQNIEAHIGVYGPLDRLIISVGSAPPMPESEVLSYIIFGKDSASLSPFEAIQLVNTLTEFVGPGTGSESMLTRIQNELGLSNLTFDMSQSGDPTVGIGQYLQDGVYFQVKQGISQEETTAVVKVDLTDHVTAETEATSGGSVGGGINMKWRY